MTPEIEALLQFLCQAFDERNRGDYEFMRQVSQPAARTAVERAREFLSTTTAFLEHPASA